MDESHNQHRPELSVVLPAYNEQEALGEAVRTYQEAFRADGLEDYELLIVNDGSRDRTGEIADALAAADPRIRVIHNERNLGQSASFLRGFGQARGRVITWNGADLPFCPRDARRMMDEIARGADVVVVERADRKAYGLKRKIVSWTNVMILRALFGSPFRDHNFVQFFRREVVESMRIVSRGVSTTAAEMIFRALRGGRRVVAVTAQYHQRTLGTSTITASKVLRALGETIHLWRTMRRENRD